MSVCHVVADSTLKLVEPLGKESTFGAFFLKLCNKYNDFTRNCFINSFSHFFLNKLFSDYKLIRVYC